MENKIGVTTNEVNLKVRKVIYFILGVLEALLGFRLIFKLLGANPASFFVSQIYGLSDFFLTPFQGVFRATVSQGIETTSILEPKTLIAMAVYGLIGYGLVAFIAIWKRPRRKENNINQ